MAPPPGGSKEQPTILVAEDDRDFLNAIEIWLSEYDDPSVTAVTNGRDAVEELDSSVDAFVCDQRMPKLTGPEVIDHLRDEGIDVPTVVISAFDPDFDESAVECYLSKPLDREDLYEALDELL